MNAARNAAQHGGRAAREDGVGRPASRQAWSAIGRAAVARARSRTGVTKSSGPCAQCRRRHPTAQTYGVARLVPGSLRLRWPVSTRTVYQPAAVAVAFTAAVGEGAWCSRHCRWRAWPVAAQARAGRCFSGCSQLCQCLARIATALTLIGRCRIFCCSQLCRWRPLARF